MKNESQSDAPQTPAEQPTSAPQPEQPVAQMQPQPVQQYVVMQKSLQGVGGWLIFWLIVFSILSIGYIMMFFTALSAPSGFGGAKVVTLLFTPFLAIGYLATVVFIAMQKKLGRLLAFATLGLSAVYTTINSIVTYVTVSDAVGSYSRFSDDTPSSVPILVGSILAGLVIHGLMALYFVLSKRVHETLVG